MIDYIEHQKHISDNVIIRDNVLERSLCGEYIVKILYKGSLNGMWNANIEYGHEKKPQWPINEWVYAIAEPETDKFISTHTSEDAEKIWNQVCDYLKKEFDIKPKLHGAHINAMNFGQEGMIHTDSDDGAHAFIIVFVNTDMNVYHGGEFQTYISMDKDYERNWDYKNSVIKYSISPKPGRIVLADAKIPHRGLTPTRFYYKTRITIAFKITFDDKDETWKKLGWNK